MVLPPKKIPPFQRKRSTVYERERKAVNALRLMAWEFAQELRRSTRPVQNQQEREWSLEDLRVDGGRRQQVVPSCSMSSREVVIEARGRSGHLTLRSFDSA